LIAASTVIVVQKCRHLIFGLERLTVTQLTSITSAVRCRQQVLFIHLCMQVGQIKQCQFVIWLVGFEILT